MSVKPWFKKGVTGDMLREMRDTLSKPIYLDLVGSHVYIRGEFSLTVRGSSRDRRQSARALARYLNGLTR